MRETSFWWIFLFLICMTIMFFLIRYLERRRIQTRLEELTHYLEQINIGNAGMLIQKEEDEFSHLQDEIYKTVTSLYQTREMAVEAKKNYADNLANIAHQIKTPITSAFLSLQLLMEKTGTNSYNIQIKKQLERLNRLEEALLTLSKIDAGALELAKEKVDIYTVLNLAAENLEELLREEQVSVLIPDKGCVEVCGDLEWTMEALMNLMKNCMEYSQPGGTVYCDYTWNPLYVEIRIWDEGKGFDKQDIPHVFERFYRGQKPRGNGIGIGLGLAKSIIELQNGTLTACNSPDKGACFEVRLYSH